MALTLRKLCMLACFQNLYVTSAALRFPLLPYFLIWSGLSSLPTETAHTQPKPMSFLSARQIQVHRERRSIGQLGLLLALARRASLPPLPRCYPDSGSSWRHQVQLVYYLEHAHTPPLWMLLCVNTHPKRDWAQVASGFSRKEAVPMYSGTEVCTRASHIAYLGKGFPQILNHENSIIPTSQDCSKQWVRWHLWS